jgi:hypothetical protein
MRTCEDDGDCRGGSYHCVDISRDDSRRIVDTNPSSRRICAIPSSSAPSPPPDEPRPPEPAVCFPSDASFDVSRPETGPISQDARPDGDRRDGAESSGEGSSEAAADGALDSTQSDTTNDAKSDAVEDAVDEAEATLSPP